MRGVGSLLFTFFTFFLLYGAMIRIELEKSGSGGCPISAADALVQCTLPAYEDLDSCL